MSTVCIADRDSTAHADPDVSELRGARILIVEPEPDRAILGGARLAQARAEPTVVRTQALARRELDAGGAFDGAFVELGGDAAGVARLLARLRLGQRPCLGVVTSAVLSSEERQSLLLRGAFEVLHHPVGAREFLEVSTRLVRGSAQLRSHVAGDARRSPHAGFLESPARRAKFELSGAVSYWTEHAKLTPRESGVLELIAMGHRYDDIAERLSITTRTVKMHAANVRRKSGARDRYELMRLLLERA